MVDLQVTLIINVAVVFVAALLIVVASLSLLRRWRLRRRETLADIFAAFSEETRPMSAVEDSQRLISFIVDPTPTVKRTPLPDSFRLPVQPGTPDQVVLSIEPEEGPTRDQRNVQKLIDFLKQETVEAEPIQRVG